MRADSEFQGRESTCMRASATDQLFSSNEEYKNRGRRTELEERFTQEVKKERIYK